MTQKEKLLSAKKVHEHSGHKQLDSMVEALKGSEAGERKVVKEVIKRCEVC